MDFVDKDKNMMPDLHNSSVLPVPMDFNMNHDEFWNTSTINDTDQSPFTLTDSPLKKRIESLIDRPVVGNKVIENIEVGVDDRENPTALLDCGEISKAKEKDGSKKEKLDVVLDCGNCSFEKVEDKYDNEYMMDLYGNLACCNSNCKQGKKSMAELISKGNGYCIWMCKYCKKKDGEHNCQKMFCNICYFEKMGSVRSRRVRK